MNKPLVSIILPVYNAEKYIKETIQSIIDQTFKDFELIIINDGSTDLSEEKIVEIEDTRINYHKNKTNLKLIDTLNLGLKLAKGKYIARIDADDIALPTRLQKQVDFLEKTDDYGIVGSFAQTFGDYTETLQYVCEDNDIRYALLTHNPFIHSTVMIRKSVLIENKLFFDKTKIHVEDYDLWIKLLDFTKGKILPEVLIKYRVHNDQISSKHKEIQEINSRNVQTLYLTKHFAEIENNSSIISIFYNEPISIIEIIALLDKLAKLNSDDSIKNKIVIQLKKKIRDRVLNANKLTLSSLIKLFQFGSFFTTKQKIKLITKIV